MGKKNDKTFVFKGIRDVTEDISKADLFDSKEEAIIAYNDYITLGVSENWKRVFTYEVIEESELKLFLAELKLKNEILFNKIR
jgi:hypothetical protein